MSILYQAKHLVVCDVKRSITITVDLNDLSSGINEKSIDIRLTDDDDLYFLYLVYIRMSDYFKIKEEQGLLVEYNGFSKMFLDLLSKCLSEEKNLSPRYILTFSDNVLRIIETTNFRHLTHLAITFEAANDYTLKAYLVDFIQKKKKEHFCEVSSLKSLLADIKSELSSSLESVDHINKQFENLKIEKNSEIIRLQTDHAADVERIMHTHDMILKSIRDSVESEKSTIDQSNKITIKDLQSKVEHQIMEIRSLQLRQDEHMEIISSYKFKLGEKDVSINNLNRINEELNSELHLIKSEIEREKEKSNSIQISLNDLENESASQSKRIKSLQDELTDAKELNVGNQEELQRRSRQVEKMEKLLKHQTTEVTKANSIIKQLQKELKNSQIKSKLRGQVATEQERILKAKEPELKDAHDVNERLRSQVESEQARSQALASELAEAKSALEEAKKTIASNDNIINWLNRQISESYVSNVHERLKSSGVPFTTSTGLAKAHFGSLATCKASLFASSPFPPATAGSGGGGGGGAAAAPASRFALACQEAGISSTALLPSSILETGACIGLTATTPSTQSSGCFVILPGTAALTSRPKLRFTEGRTTLDTVAELETVSATGRPSAYSQKTRVDNLTDPYGLLPTQGNLRSNGISTNYAQPPLDELGPSMKGTYFEDQREQSLTSAYFPKAR